MKPCEVTVDQQIWPGLHSAQIHTDPMLCAAQMDDAAADGGARRRHAGDGRWLQECLRTGADDGRDGRRQGHDAGQGQTVRWPRHRAGTEHRRARRRIARTTKMAGRSTGARRRIAQEIVQEMRATTAVGWGRATTATDQGWP
jgi:hypothetical protein